MSRQPKLTTLEPLDTKDHKVYCRLGHKGHRLAGIYLTENSPRKHPEPCERIAFLEKPIMDLIERETCRCFSSGFERTNWAYMTAIGEVRAVHAVQLAEYFYFALAFLSQWAGPPLGADEVDRVRKVLYREATALAREIFAKEGMGAITESGLTYIHWLGAPDE